ncbi:hypothetical protein BDV30DRAFT_235659 [Aspergillus minisclerotigenes]|uniref:Uncharacterized protein n=1 Tax=Aspergillus minisclerotigenes TaxID=656917 RepID=A0A5N6JD71_9EURO|nr:hypothetical protein BDV30DRAFT_235659 [Aspergillus minisclerotigenes]
MPDALGDIRRKFGEQIKYDRYPHKPFHHRKLAVEQTNRISGSRRCTPAIPWLMIEGELTRIRHADKLLILDSGFSIAAAIEGGNNEYLAAFCSESHASGCVERSFTRELEYTPVHFASTEKPSITLRPLHKMPREVAALRRTGKLADGKVLISILLEGKSSIPRIEEWRRWLMSSIPEAAALIKIEAVFELTSSICLVSMPIAVWDMLKRSDAYGFVAYVEFHNLLLSSSNVSENLESWVGNVQLPMREK